MSTYSAELLQNLCAAVQEGVELFDDTDRRAVFKQLELRAVVSADGTELEGVLTDELTKFCERHRVAKRAMKQDKEEALGPRTEG